MAHGNPRHIQVDEEVLPIDASESEVAGIGNARSCAIDGDTAQLMQETLFKMIAEKLQVVSDFANFIINILTGPVSKILGALLLIGGVIALLNGKQGVAIACGFGFMILMFIPKILEGLFKQ